MKSKVYEEQDEDNHQCNSHCTLSAHVCVGMEGIHVYTGEDATLKNIW